MFVERFDSGAVLERASPVLTFATDMRVTQLRGAGKRQDTITPPPVRHEAASRGAALPVIPRIVRRTMLDSDGIVVRGLARMAAAARRSAVVGMLVVGLVLASLGAFAGVAIRSLSDPPQPASAAPARAADATATEHPLVRAPSAPRVEQAAVDDTAFAPAPTRAARGAGGVSPPRATAALSRGQRGAATRAIPARSGRSHRRAPGTGPPAAAAAYLPANARPAARRVPPVRPKRR
jgi:hypothetical protein